ncbi:MAG: PH domain-containing protein [Candidatus Nealsonbacteria bacterium]|nr:PH domain-containing protein [Candidatus Nealsonbacteria bacterium]
MELKPRKYYVNLYIIAFFAFAGFLLLAIKLIEAPLSISVVLIAFVCLPFIFYSLLFLCIFSNVFRKISINEESLEIKGIFRRRKIPWAEIEFAELSSGGMLSIRKGQKRWKFIDLHVFCREEEIQKVAQVLKSKIPPLIQSSTV